MQKSSVGQKTIPADAGGVGISWPTPCSPHPRQAPAPSHRRGPRRSDARRLRSGSSRRKNAQLKRSGHPAAQHGPRRGDRLGQRSQEICTAVALRPAACSRAITSHQRDPSANNPCTRTTLRSSAERSFRSRRESESAKRQRRQSLLENARDRESGRAHRPTEARRTTKSP